MGRGSRLLEDPDTGIRIQISRPAEFLIGPPNVPRFVLALKDLMEALEVEHAYVSKKGLAVDIHLIRSDGWRAHMKIERRRRAWEKKAGL